MKFKKLVSIIALCAATLSGKTVKLDIDWTMNNVTGSYQNHPTEIEFPVEVSGFERVRATPYKEDGSASFAYKNAHGTITIYLKHKLIAKLNAPGLVHETYFNVFKQAIINRIGKPEKFEEKELVFVQGDDRHPGLYFYGYYPKSEKVQVSEHTYLLVIQVGDFLYYFRSTFPDPDGIDSFHNFIDSWIQLTSARG